MAAGLAAALTAFLAGAFAAALAAGFTGLFAGARAPDFTAVLLADEDWVVDAAPPFVAAALLRAGAVLTAAATAFARVDAAVAAPVAGTGFLLMGYSTT
ncbi:hypothetical protein C2862_21580 [Massilia sp. Mn16-1_5]|nr:hypothetical protein C2862_21580 [Massilia sp. Mn16-1_5]